MYRKSDYKRIVPQKEEDYRSPIRRDYGRLLHSPAFRRLQGKTQLYPGIESDFFRNRLTHSLEVAQIAKTIAIKLNHEVLRDNGLEIDPDICEFAGLAHDLGHPPFGHQGEEALDEVMRDFGGFEGNAQTLRILTRLEKKSLPEHKSTIGALGLNLTYRTIASILKYDNAIPSNSEDRSPEFLNKPMKGYYESEKSIVDKVKQNVLNTKSKSKFKSIECRIMDIADDIAYSTYDLEDGLKAGFYHPTSILTYPAQVYERIAVKVNKSTGQNIDSQGVIDVLLELFKSVFKITTLDGKAWSLGERKNGDQYFQVDAKMLDTVFANKITYMNTLSREFASNGEYRGELTSGLVNFAINGVEISINEKEPSQSDVFLSPDIRLKVEVLKNFTYESQIQSPRLKVAEFRGKQIVKEIFNVLDSKEGWMLLPEDFQNQYTSCENDSTKKRCLCDFIAGMTDKYAIEFYGRLKSEKPETIFKPF